MAHPPGRVAPGDWPAPKRTSASPWAALAGARLLPRLARATNADTVLRLVRGLPLPTLEAARLVGVDDWALKKGQTYGTILVDLEARRGVDLLPERAALPVAPWLEGPPSIELVVRDRSRE